jgi:hypothetical protein
MLIETVIAAIPATIGAVAAIDGRRVVKVTHHKVDQIDEAVNGALPGDDSIRENVQTLIQRGGVPERKGWD